ncbi:C1 family peptidase [Intrasporangium sp.]|uniref:C1 family peptidase n=1 Tax=Intrasporangium sp. TaxID=1925024 RepID=UPI0032219BD8
MPGKDRVDVGAVQRELETQNHPWEAAENHLTRLSSSERARRLGVPLPDAEHLALLEQRAVRLRASLLEGPSAGAAGLPAAFDLRNVGGLSYVSGIRDQGACGSCVAFGSVATMEGTARYQRRMPTLDSDFSEAHLYYGWGSTVGVTCDTGWMPMPALTFATNDGICFEAEWAYTAGNTNGGSAPANWQQHRAKATGTVDLTNKVDEIKAHLTTVGPVTGCFVVYTDFFSYKSGVYKQTTGKQEGGHCVAIVGYDDAQQAWIIKNSWGTGWGMGGYGLIAYGQCYIDTWSNVAVTGVNLRAWTTAKKVIGGYSTGQDRNGWVYVQDVGWLHVGGTTGTAHVAMFADLLTAKEKSAFVNAYSDDGTIKTVYAY